MKLSDGVHLTYCSNIHPGESWREVRSNLKTFLPTIREQVAPGQSLGIGLRLSSQAAVELARPEELDAWRQDLENNDFYVFTLNGFPYGRFHGIPVKADVYRPDWSSADRLRYTNLLADLLAALLPDDPGLEGSISTVPIGFEQTIQTSADIDLAVGHIIKHIAHLVAIKQRTGKTLALGLEPEPCCVLETIEQTATFFKNHLSGEAIQVLSSLTGLDHQQSREAMQTHLGVCLDLCHAAVEFEGLDQILTRLDQAEIRIVKLQISSGLRVDHFSEDIVHRLGLLCDDVYLHQVVEQKSTGLTRFIDLPNALAELPSGATDREWRIHFHVPIFHAELGGFTTTRSFVEAALERQRMNPISKHLEVETYTWDVLPTELRGMAIETAIASELNWVCDRLRK